MDVDHQEVGDLLVVEDVEDLVAAVAEGEADLVAVVMVVAAAAGM